MCAAVLSHQVVLGQQLRLRIRGLPSSQAATNPIDAARLPSTTNTIPDPTFSASGVTGGIPTSYTQCVVAACNTVSSGGIGVTAAQVNAAIAAAPASTYVLLPCAALTFSTGIDWNDKSGVAVRGCGPQGAANGGTHVVFTGSASCYGAFANWCFRNGDNNSSGNGGAESDQHNSATWTAGYSKGTTSITLATLIRGSKPVVGTMLTLDQLNDTNTDTGTIWVCTTNDICADEGGNAFGRVLPNGARSQQQFVTVTAISAGASPPWTVTISPGLYMPNWRSGQTPGAWWSSDTPITGSGLEMVSYDTTATGTTSGDRGSVTFFNAMNCWVKGVKSYHAGRAHVLFYQAAHNTIRSSYFDESYDHGSQSYGIETFLGSDNLIENNVFHWVTLPISSNGSSSGTVIAYNYLDDVKYTASADHMIAGYGVHEGGMDDMLYEGNDGPGWISDMIHGTHHFLTAFRNRFSGKGNGGEAVKTIWTNPIFLYGFSRYYNLVGNVLGTNGYHNAYATGSDTSIYDLGDNGCAVGCASDSLVATTAFRWGNYDVVNAANQFSSGEVPSGLSLYANPLPASQTLPSSIYLSAKPAYFGSNTWPGIGPDVAGGDISGLNGHAYKNPARRCYETGTKDGNGQLTNFNPTTCYVTP
jgi:hypothetical protein